VDYIWHDEVYNSNISDIFISLEIELQNTLDIEKIEEIFTKKVVFHKTMNHIIK